MSQNESLRTRVSELEVINDLFRGRVSELEQGETQTKEKDRAHETETQRLTAELATAHSRAADLQRRLDELQRESEEGPARKRMKTGSDSGADTISEVDSAHAAAQI